MAYACDGLCMCVVRWTYGIRKPIECVGGCLTLWTDLCLGLFIEASSSKYLTYDNIHQTV